MIENVAARQETAHAVSQYVYLAAGIELLNALRENLELLRGQSKLLSPVIHKLKEIWV